MTASDLHAKGKSAHEPLNKSQHIPRLGVMLKRHATGIINTVVSAMDSVTEFALGLNTLVPHSSHHIDKAKLCIARFRITSYSHSDIC